jgi:hypothetical protein
MSQEIESLYDRFLTTISSKLKIEPDLALKVMEYERKFPDVGPAVNLHIHYKTGTNRERKLDEVRSKYGFCMAREGKNTLLAQGNMSLKTLEDISNDPEIETLTGFASVASY